jgi:hypothetical protein
VVVSDFFRNNLYDYIKMFVVVVLIFQVTLEVVMAIVALVVAGVAVAMGEFIL